LRIETVVGGIFALFVTVTLSAHEFRHFSSTAIRDGVAAAANNELRTAFQKIADRGSYSVISVRRDKAGEVEIHRDWDDVFFVQEGSGVVVYGGEASGGVTDKGETRGGEIRKGTTRQLGVGDVVIIPAGMPHQVTPLAGGSITYVVLKVPRVKGSED
jgi:mannose-6-phosphate isomerase-like protein (cupin superfamily)